MARYYYFSVLSPVSFILGGKRYHFRAGDIFAETEERARRLMESYYYKDIRCSGKDPEETSEPVQEEISEPEETSEPVQEETSEPEAILEEEFPESELVQEETDSESEAIQEEPVQEEEILNSSESQSSLPEYINDDTHWSKISKYLSDLLEENPIDEEQVEEIYQRFGDYKAVKETYLEYKDSN